MQDPQMNAVDPTPNLKRFSSYEQACREFRCQIPQRFNIGAAICRRQPDAVTRIALHDVKKGGINTYTFGGLDFLSDKFATLLSESGVSQGDAVVVVLPASAALARRTPRRAKDRGSYCFALGRIRHYIAAAGDC